ncbi:MAG: hypothetical protein WC334_07170 [Kiritimatiellales bacterium]|jgi:phosphoglycerate-specific signal transduction histidine kinase
MRQWLGKCAKLSSLAAHNATAQAKIAVILLAVIPALSLFYMGTVIGSNADRLSVLTKLVIFVLTTAIAVPGFLILRKYPNNILKLRQYITEIAEGTLPEKIALADTQSSDDLKYIENNFNSVVNELRHRIATAEEQLHVEQMLKATIEQQQQTLLEAERHRAMIQTLGAACHHIGQPATVLQIRLEFLQKLATDEAVIKEIEGCITAMKKISNILYQLQQVSEFRTVPYISGSAADEAILAISPKTECCGGRSSGV